MDNKIKDVFTIWFTGLSGSGKTTFAYALQKALNNNAVKSVVLDGDKIRQTVNNDLSFSMVDREENNRRVAGIAKLINESGFHVICSLITPTNKMRDDIRKIIGTKKLILVYMETSMEKCEERDNKELYRKAKQGLIKNFTGITSAFETPVNPDIVLNGDNSYKENFKRLSKFLSQKYKLQL